MHRPCDDRRRPSSSASRSWAASTTTPSEVSRTRHVATINDHTRSSWTRHIATATTKRRSTLERWRLLAARDAEMIVKDTAAAAWQRQQRSVGSKAAPIAISDQLLFVRFTDLITSDKGGGICDCPRCLSVCLSVNKITQKRVHGFRWNFACRQMSGHGRTD